MKLINIEENNKADQGAEELYSMFPLATKSKECRWFLIKKNIIWVCQFQTHFDWCQFQTQSTHLRLSKD